MEASYVYTKIRSDFGKECMFNDRGPVIIDNCRPKIKYHDNFILKDPVHRASQCSKIQAEHDANTERMSFESHGMNHTEGGWSKDINPQDPEMVFRYKRKIEREENYLQTMLKIMPTMQHCMLQNTSVDIYQQYYDDVETVPPVNYSNARIINVFREPHTGFTRPVTYLSWAPDSGHRIAVSHCNLEYKVLPHNYCNYSYIWDLDNPNRPFFIMKSVSPQPCVEFSRREYYLLVGGMYSGQCCGWDIRRGHKPVLTSPREVSHLDPVTRVLWIHSKTASEFFSASTDGQLKWWDLRFFKKPTETLMMDIKTKGDDPQDLSQSLGVSCLEYEFSIPTRFMVGTERGLVISGNRKGRTAQEKLPAQFPSHIGPVKALQRNPFFVKNFITVGDWTAKIWSEDCKESAIVWTNFHNERLMHACWSVTRCGVYFTARSDGVVDVWDMSQKLDKPEIRVKICDDPVNYLSTHEDGLWIACGSSLGHTYLCGFSENLVYPSKTEKPYILALLEREGKREKIMEARGREIRLKLKQQEPEPEETELDVEPEVEGEEGEYVDPVIAAAEEEYFKAIDEELNPPPTPPEVEEEPEIVEPPPVVVESEPTPEPPKQEKKGKGKDKKKKK